MLVNLSWLYMYVYVCSCRWSKLLVGFALYIVINMTVVTYYGEKNLGLVIVLGFFLLEKPYQMKNNHNQLVSVLVSGCLIIECSSIRCWALRWPWMVVQ